MINSLRSVSVKVRTVFSKVLIGLVVLVELSLSGICQDAGKPSVEHGLKITFLGSTTLLIDDGKSQVLIDSFFTRPGWKSLLSISTNEDVVDARLCEYKIDDLKAIFVTHSHYDHALDIAYVAHKTGAKVYGSESTRNIGLGGRCRTISSLY